jgi:hypothetical protein
MDRRQGNAPSKRSSNFFWSFHFDFVPTRPPDLWPGFRAMPKTKRFLYCCWES